MRPLLRKSAVLYPYLAGAYFVFEGFASVAGYVPLIELFLPLVITLFFVFCLSFLVRFIVKDEAKAGLISLVILIPLLFYSKILNAVTDSFLGLGRTRYVVVILAVIVFILIWFLLKAKKDLSQLNVYLNALGAAYCLYGLILLGSSIKPYDNSLEIAILEQKKHPPQMSAAAPRQDMPDIYYIILDMYPSSDALKEYFQFDNGDFISSLKSRGFYVAQKSLAFSFNTMQSIASALNMTTDARLLDEPEEVTARIIKMSIVPEIFRSQAYEFVNLSFFDLGDSPRFYGAFTVGEESRGNFHGLFLRTAVLDVAANFEANNLYKVNLDIFARLKKIAGARRKSPRFIYAHVMMPHIPYCFDRNGNLISRLERKTESDKAAFLEQLIFTNKITLETVDGILKSSKVEPVIIIQGDHGFRQIEGADARPILNAYYLPGKGQESLDQAIIPANTFRLLFNLYFNGHYELLKDE